LSCRFDWGWRFRFRLRLRFGFSCWGGWGGSWSYLGLVLGSCLGFCRVINLLSSKILFGLLSLFLQLLGFLNLFSGISAIDDDPFLILV
jgi:hypothetical protein